MDETIYVIFKGQFDFALEVWFSIVMLTKVKMLKSLSGNHRLTLCILMDFSFWFDTKSLG